MLKTKTILFILCLQVIFNNVFAQITAEDYQRSEKVDKYPGLVYGNVLKSGWTNNSDFLWYLIKTKQGEEYRIAAMAKKTLSPAFDQVKLAQKINELTGKDFQPFNLPFKSFDFDDIKNEIVFTVDSAKYGYDLKTFVIRKIEVIQQRNRNFRYWGEADDEQSTERIGSPDRTMEAFIRDNNVYVYNKKTRESSQLSFDGSAGDYYSSNLRWSPDSKKLACLKIRPNIKRYFYFVESSPEDQLQPKLHKREYLKPGDAVPEKFPALFDIELKKQIPVDKEPYRNQYNVTPPKWNKDNSGFTVEYNQRGHQVYRVDRIDGNTGNIKTLIEEKSDKFVTYVYNYRHDVNDGKEIIWKSERDNWLHLYLIDGETGKVKNQITSGEWVIRDIIKVDEEKRTILFMANGRNKNEDPYLKHFYRINFDGSGLTDLTPENANHMINLSPDGKYFTDTYSRVDLPEITVIRETQTGNMIMQPGKSDITELLNTGWKIPEVFVSKARDEQTDIWGIIVRPSNFDPSKKYPVIEYIYAGPGNSYVPKNFSANFRQITTIAELGFIVVQTDGMGTGNRSRSFQEIIWKNLKDGGFPDRIKWIKAAAEKYPYMDISRVGIYGGSAGGQISTAALLFHPDFYKVAVSSCGCHDNRMDKIWWNEAWMGYPVGKEYEECSNVANAYKLKGNLLLMVGEMDDNVDPASTMQVVNALIKAKKEFELVVIPGAGHSHDLPFEVRKRKDFFVRHLYNSNPPNWNSLEEKSE